MKVRVTLTEDDGDKAVEVLVINGGAESTAALLKDVGDYCEAEVEAPQALVLREALSVN